MANILSLLPGYNCGECGYRQCKDFGRALSEKDEELETCPHINSERFSRNIPEIREIINGRRHIESDEIKGVIDGLDADFTIGPLPGECSCREDLHPFDSQMKLEKGDYVRYRPFGCPITHFAKVLNHQRGIVTVHLVGPIHRINDSCFSYQDIGLCMVAGFDGLVRKGNVPDVGQTVKFLPEHCMMQKVHSGIIVHSEGKRVRIESVDLKVW